VEFDHDSDSGEPSDGARESNFVTMGLLFYGAMAIVAVLWRNGLMEESIVVAPDAEIQVGQLWVHAAIGLGFGVFVVVASNLVTRFTHWGEDLARAMAASLGYISTPNAVLLAMASGLAEEMFFRGALQAKVGLVLASLLFGVVHFVPRREFMPWTVFAVVVGFGLGGLFEWTGNLLAPVVAHVVINGVNLPLLIRRYGSEPKAPPPG
jgi:membrane protease YdiL (CAAX protease family)